MEKKSQAPRRPTKKEQILSFYANGMTSVNELSELTDARPSYVASVLQESGLLSGYFDLYTNSSHPMNVYSELFSGKLGFKTEEVAAAGVEFLEGQYRQFSDDKDRAGQHHALMVALTMFDRARWSGKTRAAEHYKRWLMSKLDGIETRLTPLDRDPPRH